MGATVLAGFIVSLALLALGGCGASSHDSKTTTGGGTPNGTAVKASFSSLRSAVFTPQCGSCHGFDNYATAHADAKRIWTEVSSGAMPPGGSLSSAQKTALKSWVAAGAPNN